MSSEIPFDPAGAIQTAKSYYDAAHVLDLYAEQTRARVQQPGANLNADLVEQMSGERAVPVVLRALAVEILLKVRLHRANVRVPREHNHAKLFALLPDEDRRLLESRYAAGRRWPFISTTLQAALEWSGEAFMKWRYRYEWRSVNASVGEMILAYNVLLGEK